MLRRFKVCRFFTLNSDPNICDECKLISYECGNNFDVPGALSQENMESEHVIQAEPG